MGTNNTGVNWSLSPAVGVISAAGLYTAPSLIAAPQTVIVTATSVASSSRSASATVGLNPPVGVTMTPASVSLTQAQTQSFTAIVANATNAAVTWSISPSVGTISAAGLYTAPPTILAAQTVTVIAQSVADPTKSASAVVRLPIGTFTYYVDSVSGSDSNPGTLAKPWKTIAKVNSATLIPGQSVGFVSGGEWRETLTPAQSGTAANPITFGAYGSGTRPIISGANLASWTQGTGTPISTTVWYTTQTSNPSWPSFRGVPGTQVSSLSAVAAANEWYWDGSSKLYVYSTSNPATTVEIPTRSYAVSGNGQSHLRFTDLEMRGALLHGFQCYTAGSTSCNDLGFNSVLADLNYGHGIYIQTGSAGSATGGSIVSSTVTNNGGSCIVVGGEGPFSNWTISGNTLSFCSLYYNGSDSIHAYTGGIYVNTWATQNGGSGTVISGNYVHDIGYSGNPTGAGIWSDTTTGIIISGNTINNCSFMGLYLEKTLNEQALYNSISNCGARRYSAGLGVAAGGGFASRNNLICNNTVYNSGWWGFSSGFEDNDEGTAMSGNIAMNNIFDLASESGNSLYVDSNTAHSTSFAFSHNNMGVQGGGCFICYSGCVSTYSGFDSTYGSSTYSVGGAPQFVSAPTNLALQTGSPAIGAGVYITGVSTANPPNIGAY